MKSMLGRLAAVAFCIGLAGGAPVSAQGASESANDEQSPIHNLFEAWRRLDTRLYISQWAPNGVKIDLRTGARQAPAALLADRTRLFSQLEWVDADYSLRLEDSQPGEAIYRVSYALKMQFKGGRQFLDRACETYRVQNQNGVWLIVRNEDYAPCR